MKNNIKILVIGIIAVLLLIPSIGAIQTGDSGFMYYVFGDNTVTPVFVFNQSGNDSMLYVDDDGLYVQNHVNNWFRITGNDSVGGDGGFDYDSWFNQKLNTSDSPTFVQPIVAALTVLDYIVHGGDADTLMTFLTDNIIFTAGNVNMLEFVESTSDELVVNEDSVDMDFRVETNGNDNMLCVDGGDNAVGIGGNPISGTELHVYDADGDSNIHLETDNTDGNAVISFVNDAITFRWMINGPLDRMDLYDASNTDYDICVEGDMNDYALYLNSPSQVCMFQTAGSIGKEVDVNGDHEATSYLPVSDIRCKTIVLNLNEIGDNLILKLCRFIDYYVFQWKNPYFVDFIENGTIIYKAWNGDGYGVSCIAQWLYEDLLNFTGNEQLNYKIANGIVSVGDDNNEWSINKDNLAMIYHRAWQINDKRITLLEQEVFG